MENQSKLERLIESFQDFKENDFNDLKLKTGKIETSIKINIGLTFIILASILATAISIIIKNL